jgi:nuclear GTP-binding protein
MKRARPGFKKGASADNPDRLKDSKDISKRSKDTINRLNMYRSGKAVRNKHGKIVGGTLMSRTRTADKPMDTVARVAPDRRWFGNTRVIAPQALDKFREELGAKVRCWRD